jgi:hypothetical protein
MESKGSIWGGDGEGEVMMKGYGDVYGGLEQLMDLELSVELQLMARNPWMFSNPKTEMMSVQMEQGTDQTTARNNTTNNFAE